jgi:hypothetical protein
LATSESTWTSRCDNGFALRLAFVDPVIEM